jgi:hypothetical protein
MRAASILLLFSIASVAGCTAAPKPKREQPSIQDDTKAGDSTGGSNDDEVLEGSEGEPTGETPGAPDTPPGPATPAGTKIRWNAISGFKYMLAIKAPEGDWVFGCVSPTTIGNGTSVTYEGICPNAPARIEKPTAFRIYFSPTDKFGDFVEQPGGGSEIAFDLPTTPPASVPVSWNQKSATAEYSLDVVLQSGETVAPCVHAGILGKSLSTTYSGSCYNRSAAIGDIREFRICWTEGGDWAKATCAGIPYSGLGRQAKIFN